MKTRLHLPGIIASSADPGHFLLLLATTAAFGADSGADRRRVPADTGNLKDLSLEELMDVQVRTVYSASKRTQTLAEAPASVTIITADEIRKYGYRTLADILQSVRGFFVTYDRNYDYLGVRGFGRTGDYNSRVLLMVDGHRINDNVYDSAAIGTEFILDVDLIDRVEIVRGPASALYGSNAFFGVINVITRQRDGPEGRRGRRRRRQLRFLAGPRHLRRQVPGQRGIPFLRHRAT